MRLKMNHYIRRWDNEVRRWIYEHREVLENHLGRKLRSGEHVHHVNGNHLDNRLKNLAIVTTSEHMSIHKPVVFRKWRSIKIRLEKGTAG